MRARLLAAFGTTAAAAAVLGVSGGDDDRASVASAAAGRAPANVALKVTKRGSGKWALRAPKTVRAGLVRLTLEVPAGRVTHDAQFIRVEGEHTAKEVLAVIAGQASAIPKWAFLAGGVGQTDGDAAGRTVQRLQPGRYFIVDTDEPEGDEVKSYAESGAITTLEVTGKPTKAKLPRAGGTVTAREYAFTTRGLRAGRVRVGFRNTGRQPHHVIAFPYNDGATLADAKAFFAEEGEPTGPPPVDFARAVRTAALEGGDAQVADLDLKRGKYALICFITDRAGGPPHVAKGMIAEAVVR